MRKLACIVLGAVVMGAFAVNGKASPIISDPLTGSGNLNGSGPTTDTYNTGDTWTASTSPSFTRGGTGATVPGNGSNAVVSAGSLAFVPASGNIYALSATFTLGSGSNGDWLCLGFSPSKAATFPYNTAGTGPWMLIRTTAGSSQFAGDIQTFYSGTSGSSYTGANSGTAGTTQTLEVVLNTTNPAWVASWYENSTLLGSYTYGSNPSIGAVDFGQYKSASGTVSNFMLVPEPGVMGLLALGGLGALGQRRRRSS